VRVHGDTLQSSGSFSFQVVMPCRKTDEEIITHPFGNPTVLFALLPEKVKIWQFGIYGHNVIYKKDKIKLNFN
jgi:hypothetical protein